MRRELAPPPYLLSPPDVISIDLGRQLFVDDFLIEHTTLTRVFHSAEYHDGNPILVPDRPWERGEIADDSAVMPYSDGVWYDPAERLFKMWYRGGSRRTASTCYAVSQDGIAWEKPELDVEAGTNIVHERNTDTTTVWLDLEDRDPHRRYKMFVPRKMRLPRSEERMWGMLTHFSADGIHWGEPVCCKYFIPTGADRTTAFYNPFRQVWVYSIKEHTLDPSELGVKVGRFRRYWETPEVTTGEPCAEGRPVPWICADGLDPFPPATNAEAPDP